MARICIQCHAELASETMADWCPACGGTLIDRDDPIAGTHHSLPQAEVDHRGIVLPRRHTIGGIITPQ